MNPKTLAITLLGTCCGLLVSLPGYAHTTTSPSLRIGHTQLPGTYGSGRWFNPAPAAAHRHDAQCYRRYEQHDQHWARSASTPHVRREHEQRHSDRNRYQRNKPSFHSYHHGHTNNHHGRRRYGHHRGD